MNSARTCLLAAVVLLFATPGVFAQQLKPKSPDTGWSMLNATWKPVSGSIFGQVLPDAQLSPIQFSISNGKFEFIRHDIVESGTLVIAAPVEKGMPSSIDVVIEKGPSKGTTMKGIYRIENGKLRVCYAMAADKPRPREFVSTAENKTLLLEYERKTR